MFFSSHRKNIPDTGNIGSGLWAPADLANKVKCSFPYNRS